MSSVQTDRPCGLPMAPRRRYRPTSSLNPLHLVVLAVAVSVDDVSSCASSPDSLQSQAPRRGRSSALLANA
jgi:hypothetical protein